MGRETNGEERAARATPVSSAEVARAAGVSKWTVIRAFESNGRIAPATRARVMEVADALGYRPNLLARSLATRRTHLVAILVDDFLNPFKMPALDLITAGLQREGMLAILVNIGEDYGHSEAIINAWQRRLDAIVLFGTTFHPEVMELIASGQNVPPHFVLGRHSTVRDVASVSCDATHPIAEAAAHLWDRGYRRPVYMGIPLTISTSLGRRRAYQGFWRDRGIDLPEISVPEYSRAEGAAAAARFFAETPRADWPDVLICENDVLAIGAIEEIRGRLGLRVPQDVAVIGYDDIDLAGLPSFALTTIRQPVEEMVALLVDMIAGRRPAENLQLPGRFVARASA